MKIQGVALLLIALLAVVTGDISHNNGPAHDAAWKEHFPSGKKWGERESTSKHVKLHDETMSGNLKEWDHGDDNLKNIDHSRFETTDEEYEEILALASTPEPETSPVFTKGSELWKAIEPNHQKFVDLKKFILEAKEEGKLTYGQTEVFLARVDEIEGLLRSVEDGLEPFGPFIDEKAFYAPGILEHVEELEDRMVQLVHERKALLKAVRSTIKMNFKKWDIKAPGPKKEKTLKRGRRNSETLVDAKAEFLMSEDELRDSLWELEDENKSQKKVNMILILTLTGAVLVFAAIITVFVLCIRRSKRKEQLKRLRSLADVEEGFSGSRDELLPNRSQTRSSKSMPRLPSTQQLHG